jgi:hypothetical protein
MKTTIKKSRKVNMEIAMEKIRTLEIEKQIKMR